MDSQWFAIKVAQIPALETGACDVWLLSLKQDVLLYENLLSPEEKARASRFVLSQVRHRFVAARGLMRQLLGHYLRVAPEALAFEVTTAGKPYLASYPHLYFNLSHSEDYALLAVNTVAPVGVDLEALSDTVDYEGLMHRFFSSIEQKQFNMLAPSIKKTAFFNGWCAKEAWVKAHGSNLAEGLKHSEAEWNEEGEVQAVHHLKTGSYTHDLSDLPSIKGFAAYCVVLEKIQTWRCYALNQIDSY